MAKELALILIEEQRNYDITTCPFPRNLLEQFREDGYLVYGLVDDIEHKVYLWDKMSMEEKRLTIIHEALHTHYSLTGQGWTENNIREESKKLYKQIYNKTAPKLK